MFLLKPIRDPTVINLISSEQQTRFVCPNDSLTTTSNTTGDLAGFQLLVDVAVKELHRIQQDSNSSFTTTLQLVSCVFLFFLLLVPMPEKHTSHFFFFVCVNSMFFRFFILLFF